MTEKPCPKCGQKMAKKSAVYALPQRAPQEVMVLAGVRVNPERTLDLIAYHRSKCSCVEFYTADFFMLNQPRPTRKQNKKAATVNLTGQTV